MSKADRIVLTMKIGLYDPYLDTLGGGEKYIFDIASCLSVDNNVFIFWDDQKILKLAEKRFSIDLSQIKLFPNMFTPQTSFIKKFFATKQFDAIIFLSDGSIPWLFAKRNILLFQFPVTWIDGETFLQRQKLARISNIICYSDFVKKFLDITFKKNSVVIPPLITRFPVKEMKKDNIILSVGRFTQAMNAKKQEILIESFKEMVDKGLEKWHLVLAGGALQEDEDFVETLRNKAKGYPIEIFQNISFEELTDLYERAKIYWHGAGYGEDLEKNPEKAEHFGITTIEAMSYGEVPVVFNGGGQREIVKNRENGLLWDTTEELQEITKKLMKDVSYWKRLSLNARERAKDFNKESFCEKIREVVVYHYFSS